MDMGVDDLGNAPSQEIPYNDSAIITAHRKQRALAVEGACDSDAHTVQGAIKVLHNSSGISHHRYLSTVFLWGAADANIKIPSAERSEL